MICVTNLTKTYKMGEHLVHALRGVSISIEDGDFVAIMGPSGSGKSTLAHILGLLDGPSSGTYQLNSKEVSHLSEDELSVLRREEIGFIFQQFNLLPRLSALQNVTLPLLYSKKDPNSALPMELLTRIGLGDRGDHRPNELSGGQQQRVAVARSLVNQPRMILADEPTGNLDSKSEKEIMAILQELNARGITIVMVTHEEEIGNKAKRLIRMRDGQVQSDERLKPVVNAQPLAEKQAVEVTPNSWLDFLEHFKQGIKSLAANKIRTALSMLGVLIGVGAVVTMLALGKGAQSAIESQLSSLGSNLLVLRPGSTRVAGVTQDSGAANKLTLDDLPLIKEQVSNIRDLSANVSGKSQVTYLDKNWSTQTQGSSPSYESMRNSTPSFGRFFTEEENKKRAMVAVIGATVVRELFGTQNPLGEMIKINKINFQVIGVLPEKGASGWRDQDDVVLIPITTAMHRVFGREFVESIDIEVTQADKIDDVQKDILDLMAVRKHIRVSQQEGAFQIMNMADIQAALTQTSQTLTLLLATIAAISLLVGGIGIMNIMLVSVTERTKEIGLRKAIGARRGDILMQFLAESVAVSAIGGILGILLGVTASMILSVTTGWATSVSLSSVLVSFLFSAAIGIIFGVYPARKASLLHPIDALRFE